MGADRSIPVIGVTGGVGAGKSTFATALGERGCAVIDADAVGHALLETPEVKRRIAERWGAGLFDPDGQVDRNALGDLVFADPVRRRELESLLHPRMRREFVRRIERYRREGAIAVVLDAAVLFEAGWDELCTHTVFVDAPEQKRFQRVKKTRNWDKRTFQSRQYAQISLDIKARRCCYTVRNDSAVPTLLEQADNLLHQITCL